MDDRIQNKIKEENELKEKDGIKKLSKKYKLLDITLSNKTDIRMNECLIKDSPYINLDSYVINCRKEMPQIAESIMKPRMYYCFIKEVALPQSDLKTLYTFSSTFSRLILENRYLLIRTPTTTPITNCTFSLNGFDIITSSNLM